MATVKYMYHWTHVSNLPSIARDGLRPDLAKGRLKVCWACDETRVAWAVGHVSAHHETTPDEMVLLRIRVAGLDGRRTSWPAVRVYERRIPASRITGVRTILATRWTSLRRYR